jgi:hypothetical protein
MEGENNLQEIEQLRILLSKLYTSTGSLTDPILVKASQLLDQKLNEYQQLDIIDSSYL